jgi:hypothetical protein
MATPKIILVVNNPLFRDRYLKELDSYDVDCRVVPSLRSLHERLIDNAAQGILIDFPTKIAASPEEQQLLHMPLQLFPVMLIRWDKNDDLVKGVSIGVEKNCCTTAEFIDIVGSKFQPRTIRAHPRLEVHLNVLLALPGIAEQQKTITQNVSLAGCFIIAAASFDGCPSCTFSIAELGSDKSIAGEIRWRAPWGVHPRFPGIGVKFSLEEEMLEALGKFLK